MSSVPLAEFKFEFDKFKKYLNISSRERREVSGLEKYNILTSVPGHRCEHCHGDSGTNAVSQPRDFTAFFPLEEI